VESFEHIKTIMSSVEEDIVKAEGGNKAAGTRVRQAMQEVKNAAQDVRKGVLALRSSD